MSTAPLITLRSLLLRDRPEAHSMLRMMPSAPLGRTYNDKITFLLYNAFDAGFASRSERNDFTYVKPFIRFVTNNKKYILDFTVREYFGRDLGHPTPRFTNVGFKLEDAGIKYMGDFVKMSESDFRNFTRNEAIIAHVKECLALNEFTFDMATPRWERPNTQSYGR